MKVFVCVIPDCHTRSDRGEYYRLDIGFRIPWPVISSYMREDIAKNRNNEWVETDYNNGRVYGGGGGCYLVFSGGKSAKSKML